MVIQKWSKQDFHPDHRHSGGVGDTPQGFFFKYKFIGKMLNFNVKKRDCSLTSWPEFSVIIHWQNKPFRTHTLKTSQSHSSRTHVWNWLKYWRKYFLEGCVHGRGHPAILQTGKSPDPVVGGRHTWPRFFIFLFFLKKRFFVIFNDFSTVFVEKSVSVSKCYRLDL
jgi:hypothetical protein